jgi:hypothetical protein
MDDTFFHRILQFLALLSKCQLNTINNAFSNPILFNLVVRLNVFSLQSSHSLCFGVLRQCFFFLIRNVLLLFACFLIECHMQQTAQLQSCLRAVRLMHCWSLFSMALGLCKRYCFRIACYIYRFQSYRSAIMLAVKVKQYCCCAQSSAVAVSISVKNWYSL